MTKLSKIFKIKWLTIAVMYLIVVDKVIDANLNKGGTFILTDCIQFDNSISLASIGNNLEFK